jgi:hypothetical protein
MKNGGIVRSGRTRRGNGSSEVGPPLGDSIGRVEPKDVVRHPAESIVPYLFRPIGVGRVSQDDHSATYTPRSFFMRMGVERFNDHRLIGSGFANCEAESHHLPMTCAKVTTTSAWARAVLPMETVVGG